MIGAILKPIGNRVTSMTIMPKIFRQDVGARSTFFWICLKLRHRLIENRPTIATNFESHSSILDVSSSFVLTFYMRSFLAVSDGPYPRTHFELLRELCKKYLFFFSSSLEQTELNVCVLLYSPCIIDPVRVFLKPMYIVVTTRRKLWIHKDLILIHALKSVLEI